MNKSTNRQTGRELRVNTSSVRSRLKSLGIFLPFCALGFLVSYFFSPIIITKADSNGAEQQVNVSVGTMIGLATSGDVNMSGHIGDFVSAPLSIYTSTNSTYGYTLRMSAIGDNTTMTHEDTSVSNAFTSTFTGSKTSSTMEDNTWGYSRNGIDFYRIPVQSKAITVSSSNGPMLDSPFVTDTLYYGAKIGMDAISGDYTGTIKLTAYVNGMDGLPADDDPTWEEEDDGYDRFTLTYDNQSGSGCTSTVGIAGRTWGTLCEPTRNADDDYTYSFDGWYTGTDGSGTQVTADSTVSENLTVYAKWNAAVACSGKMLADGNCWSMVSGRWLYSDAERYQCPSGFSVATRAQIDTLISSYSGDGLYNALGLSGQGYFWFNVTTDYLYVYLNSAYVQNAWYNELHAGVACIKN